jgi:riboflavin synthase
VKALLAGGATVNTRLLVKTARAIVNGVRDTPITALRLALTQGHADVVEVLKAAGATE